MASVNLAPYDPQTAELERRMRMAQALQEAGATSQDVPSYKGISAMPSKAGMLANILQSYLGARQERNVNRDQAALSTSRGEEAQNWLSKATSQLMPQQAAPVAPPQAAPIAAPQPDPDLGGQSGASANAGIPSDPRMAQQPIAAPQQIAQAMGGQPPAAPAKPTLIPGGNATPQQMPLEQLQAMILQASSSANPQLRNAAAQMMPILEQRMTRQQQLDDRNQIRTQQLADRDEGRTYADTHTETLRKQDVDRATEQANALISGGNFSDAQANVIRQAAAAGSEALNSVRTTVMSKAFADHNSILTPAEIRAMGFPPGSVVSKNDTTGALTLEYNPLPDQTARLNAGISAANLALSRERFAAERSDKESALLPPETIHQMAFQAWQGDKSVFQNLGRGVQGAANIVALRNEVARLGAEQGRAPGELASMNAYFAGTTREQAAIGQRSGAAKFALSEVVPVARLSSEAYAKLPRGQFRPINHLVNAAQIQFSSPEQAASYTADLGLAVAYARALNPNGIPREADIKSAERRINQAQSQGAHEAVVQQILSEVEAINKGADVARTPPPLSGPAAGGGRGSGSPPPRTNF